MNWELRRKTEAALKAAGEKWQTLFASAPLVTDSRRVTPGSVFVALRGERFDAHDFLSAVREAGAVAVVDERETPVDMPQLVVPDTRWAYMLLAAQRRRRFDGPVLAVVGSNGKTTTTQMLAAILKEAFGDAFWATKGNFNNELGVSHTLLSMKAGDRMGLVEAGMNHPGEMAQLADMVRPDVVLVTNAQREHQEFLATVEATAYENGFMIAGAAKGARVAVPADDACAGIWEAMCVAAKKEAWLYTIRPDGRGVVRGSYASGVLTLETPAGTCRIALRIQGEHNVHNATGAACAAVAAGVPLEAVQRGLEAFEALPGRGARTTFGAFTLIDDAYNANPDSVRASMRMTAEAPGPRIFVLGAMGEIGAQSARFHREMGEWARSCGLDELWTVGEEPRLAAEAFGKGARTFSDCGELLAKLQEILPAAGTLTVKASHSAGLERVVRAIEACKRETSRQ